MPGDWAEGWNLPRLRTVMGLHYGFTAPTQCIKYLLGSHDQVRAAWPGILGAYLCHYSFAQEESITLMYTACKVMCACFEMSRDELEPVQKLLPVVLAR